MYFTDDKKPQRFEREMKIVPNFDRKEIWEYAEAAVSAKITRVNSNAARRIIARISSERSAQIRSSQEIWRLGNIKTAVEEMESGIWDLTLFTCTVDGQTRVTVRCSKE